MRMASVLLMTLSAVMSMQAETAGDILEAMKGDTITFAYSDNGNYYLMAGENGTSPVVAVSGFSLFFFVCCVFFFIVCSSVVEAWRAECNIYADVV